MAKGINDLAAQSKDAVKPSQEPGQGAINSREVHKYSDVDLNSESQHHTLGTGPTQAAAGTHLHDSRYAALSHTHPAEDLPSTDLLDEVVVSVDDPTIARPDLPVGTIWLNPAEIDADIELVDILMDDVHVATINSTTFQHPAKWGRAGYVPPVDGVISINSSVLYDGSGLSGSGAILGRIMLCIVDESGALVGTSFPGQMSTESKQKEYRCGSCMAQVSGGQQYFIELRTALSGSASGSFTLTDWDASLVFFPSGQYTSITLETRA